MKSQKLGSAGSAHLQYKSLYSPWAESKAPTHDTARSTCEARLQLRKASPSRRNAHIPRCQIREPSVQKEVMSPRPGPSSHHRAADRQNPLLHWFGAGVCESKHIHVLSSTTDGDRLSAHQSSGERTDTIGRGPLRPSMAQPGVFPNEVKLGTIRSSGFEGWREESWESGEVEGPKGGRMLLVHTWVLRGV